MKTKTNENIFQALGLTRQNLNLFLLGVITILLGYAAMAIGGKEDALSLVIAPLLLVAGYAVIIPLAILYRPKAAKKE